MTIQYRRQPDPSLRVEPMMSLGRTVLPPVIALPAPQPHPQTEPHLDLRNVSPRRFAEITHELYLAGILRWEEYQWVGFPSDLHPDFDITIGALTGEKAQPDRPRDMLGEVEERIAFLKRHGGNQTPGFWRAERALDVLRNQDTSLAA